MQQGSILSEDPKGVYSASSHLVAPPVPRNGVITLFLPLSGNVFLLKEDLGGMFFSALIHPLIYMPYILYGSFPKFQWVFFLKEDFEEGSSHSIAVGLGTAVGSHHSLSRHPF